LTGRADALRSQLIVPAQFRKVRDTKERISQRSEDVQYKIAEIRPRPRDGGLEPVRIAYSLFGIIFLCEAGNRKTVITKIPNFKRQVTNKAEYLLLIYFCGLESGAYLY
jgi:hypothetical protein